MTALADVPVAQAGPHANREPGSRGPGPGPAAVPAAARSGAVRDQAQAIRSWPLLVLAVPAAEVWSGWVGIAQKTGFGDVPLLPGIWSSLHLDTAVTLPVGVECYAAYALRAWLSGGHAISDRTRRFARRSAIFSFALGMAGQVAFHLIDQDHVTKAPWGITTLVSCLPVLVLGMGSALAHMLREDAAAADQPEARPADRPTCGPRGGPPGTSPRTIGTGTGIGTTIQTRASVRTRTSRGRSGTGRTGPGPWSGPFRLRGPASPHSLAGLGSTARCRRPRRSPFPGPGGRSGILDRPQASHSREARVPAGTAQRRGQGVQREPERTRPPAQRRIRQQQAAVS